ncbi:hypothetical protein QQF64_034188 [Cirrhinus molitorella]|uniref:Uncharacterized protein n=1 Tax=Cirrhinus molitorella TaxID=172907 RepID=A0ABR3MWA0_9TELE
MENDIGYTMYLIKNLQKEASGILMAEGHGKDTEPPPPLPPPPPPSSPSTADLEQSTKAVKEPSSALSKPPADRKSELQVLSDVPAQKTSVPLPEERKFLVQEPARLSQSESSVPTTGDSRAADTRRVCRTLTFEECGIDETTSHIAEASHKPLSSAPDVLSVPSLAPLQKTAQSTPAHPRNPPPQLSYDHDIRHWKCSQHQKIWMKTELESMGRWPGSIPVSNPMKTVSLWRLPPQPELLDTITDLPSPKYFQLHPFFIWKPENDTLMVRLRNNYALPCIEECRQPQVTSAGVGRPCVIASQVNITYSHRVCAAKSAKRNGMQTTRSGWKSSPKDLQTCCQQFLLMLWRCQNKTLLDNATKPRSQPPDLPSVRPLCVLYLSSCPN